MPEDRERFEALYVPGQGVGKRRDDPRLLGHALISLPNDVHRWVEVIGPLDAVQNPSALCRVHEECPLAGVLGSARRVIAFVEIKV